jgi:serine phosphatase RsbU (regulator of sigma subunit)
MILDAGEARNLPLDHGGPPIGMFPEADWPDARYELSDDWSILLYTDGAIEARDGNGGLLGEEGLCRLVSEQLAAEPSWRADPDALLTGVVDHARELHGEPFSDDVALLALGAR